MSDTIRRRRPLALIRRGRWGRGRGKPQPGVAVAPSPMRSIEYGSTRWVDVRSPSGEQIDEIGSEYKLHPLVVDDIKSRIQRPKIDIYPDDYLFIVLKFPIHDKERRVNQAAEVDIIVGENLFMTFHDGSLRPLVTLIDSIFESDELSIELLRQTPSHLLYEVVDRLVDYLVPIVPMLEDRVTAIEEMIFELQALETVQEISIVQRDLISMRRILRPLQTILNRFEVASLPFMSEDIDDYWGDVTDHLGRTIDQLDELSEILAALSDTHDKLVSQRMNDIIKTLTIFTVIMLPLTVIAGFFGMNVPMPWAAQWVTTVFILLAMLGLALGMFEYFRRRQWL